MDPSLEALVAIIAVLRSGGAYVPIATDTPPALINHILADAKVKIVLSNLAAGWFGDTCLLTPQTWRHDDPEYQSAEISPQQLAYVIYTSGSTGRPKGVMVEHANLEHSLASRREFYGKTPYRALLLPSLAFDSSVAVIFPVLCQGGTLIIASQAERRDPMALLNLIERHSVTEMLALPVVYQTILETPGASRKLPCLQRVILAGDRLANAIVEKHFQICQSAELYNEYGPTEATVWSTVYRCTQVSDTAPVPIGDAIPGTSVYILDAQTLTPSAPGIEGELFIGGASVSRGYLGDSTQTAVNFLPDPFAITPGARLYCCGDRGQMNANGIEFIGRNDDQVKIRGYRVALGHVENEMNSHPGIQAAVVVVRRNAPWKDQIVAFFESRNLRIGIQELKPFLAQRLSDYMVPLAYIQLPRLPRTPHGKLDRMRMATFAIEQMFSDTDSVPPRTTLEEQLCDVWCEVLDVPKIGVFDHYMDFGADSITAMQFSTAARSRGISVMPADVFVCGTIAAMAGTISERHQDGNLPHSEPSNLPTSEGPFYRRKTQGS